MKKNPSFISPSPFSLSNPFFAQTVTITIVIAIHRNNCQQCMWPALSSPPFPSPRNEATINNQSSSSLWGLKLLSAYAMLPPSTHCCCRRHHHAAAAFPNMLLLPLKLHFRQAAASAAKLATATILTPLPTLPPCGHRHATTAYKIIKNVKILTNLFFTTMVTAACSNDGRATRQRW